MRALILAGIGAVPAYVTQAWCAAGHSVAEVWLDGRQRAALRRERRWSFLAPRWSLAAAIRRHRLPLRFVDSLRAGSAEAEAMAALDVDVILSVHFMRILPGSLLARLRVPVFNLHPALLPAYRGPSPVVGMALDGAAAQHGGVTLHVVDAGIDTGPVIAAMPVPPQGRDLSAWEFDLARAAARLAVDVVPAACAGRATPVPQDESAASYRRIEPSELRVSPADSVAAIRRRLTVLAGHRKVPLLLGGRAFPIVAIIRELGPPTGAPPRIRPLTIECDVADARVVLRRRLPLTSQRQRLAWLLARIVAR